MLKLELRLLVRTAILAALAIVIQIGNLPQLLTGPAINAILFVATMFISPISGVLIGIMTPWIALVVGIMKLAPAIPVIIAGNITLVLVAGLLKIVNRYLAFAVAPFAKYIVMTLGVKYLIASGTNIPAPAYATLTATQLVTALIGAFVAIIVLETLKRFFPDDIS